jgi:hypothetical protein
MKLQKAVFILMAMMLLLAGKLSAQQVKTDLRSRRQLRAVQDLLVGTS